MEQPLNQSALAPTKSRLARTFAKVLHTRAATRAATLDKTRKTKSTEKTKHDIDHKKIRNQAAMDAFIAKVFATISSVKAAYAQLQYAQSPYDADGIQSADQIMVSELKTLSEFKQLFIKKHLDDNEKAPETTQLLAEIQEQKNLLQMYEITTKTLDSQKKLKDSEIIFLKEKLQEANKENKLVERRLNSSGPLSPLEKLTLSSLSPKGFVLFLQQMRKSVTSFVKLLMSEMEEANWDLNAAASSIQPDVIYRDTGHICYAFESFVYQVMFDGFNNTTNESNAASSSQYFFDKFVELKSIKASEYITWKPNSTFARFCYSKYLRLVHPIMEFALFGNMNQRNLVGAQKPPETAFFSSFAEMAKRVYLLHCLALVFDPSKASVFQVRKGSRFSEVYMESVNEEPVKSSPEVSFTVVPGFKMGKTVIQCQVYLT
ncbi:gravitropic in the light 1-like protein isoform X2 [Tanacetum coccineum]